MAQPDRPCSGQEPGTPGAGAARAVRPGVFAVIFSSQRTGRDPAGYAAAAERLERLARAQPGFVDVESVSSADGRGVTISYWTDLEAIRRWREQAEHLVAQKLGKAVWYAEYRLVVCRVEQVAEHTAALSASGTAPPHRPIPAERSERPPDPWTEKVDPFEIDP